LRAGKVAKATDLLSQVADSFPLEQPTNEPSSLADGLLVDHYTYAGTYMRGELGALRLAQRQYTQALDAFLRGDYWWDAAYVAERVMTTDELKSYVDANWPAIAPSPNENADDEENVWHHKDKEEQRLESLTEDLRHLLARRLTRESHIGDAQAYYPDEWVPQAQQLMHALTAGWDESLPAEQRARALATAAFVLRTNGMELMGTETDPDWSVDEGNFEDVSAINRRTNAAPVLLAPSADEIKRNRESAPDPDKRYHYRYQAAELAWEAAKLMPNNSDETARLLCTAGSWLKYLEPKAADRFYKALVRRCRKTEIGAKADKMRWFPELDADGNLRRSRFELMDLPSVNQIASGGGIATYPTPGKHLILSAGDRMSDLVAAVQRLGIDITVKDIYAANPELDRWGSNTGREILIPLPQEAPVMTSSSQDEPMPEVANPPIGLPDTSDADERTTYVAVKGDTIAKIAMQFGVSLQSLLEANPGLGPNQLKIGQKIRIPSSQ
jgi:hypothetical protein